MQLSFLGAAREVGRSGVLLETKKSKVLFDYGAKMADQECPEPQYPLPVHGFLDAVLLSHAHLDHSGSIPFLFQAAEPKVLAHTATVPIAQLLLEDSLKIAADRRSKCFTKVQLKRMMRNTDGISYDKEYLVTSDIAMTLRDAGHILGAGMIEATAEGKAVTYSGDFKFEKTCVHEGAKPPRKCDAMIVEATYGDRTHPDRKELEKKFIAAVREVLEGNGSVLLPCFALGRTQEMVAMLHAHKIEVPVYMDGMARAVSEIYMEFPELISNYDKFYSAMKWVNWIVAPSKRDEVFNEPSVVISPAGMLTGGPSVRYIQSIRDVNNSAVFFTGYQVPGTPGAKLLESKKFDVDEYKVDCGHLDIRHFDFSAHGARDELHKAIKAADPSVLFVNHGEEEQCEALRKWAEDELGCYAFSPRLGEKYVLEDYL